MRKIGFLLLYLFCAIHVNAQSEKGVWRVVLVAATAEQGVAAGAEAFLSYATKDVERMAAVLDLSLELTIIQGKDLQPAKVNELLTALKKAPNTAAKSMLTWISFTHGFNTASSSGQLPYMIAHPTKTVLSSQEMRYAFAIGDIYQQLLVSGVYDHVHVWAELCNHICHGCQNVPTEGLVKLGGKGGALAQLLYSVEGEVMVSSSYGQSSCSTTVGGPFTRALFEALSMMETGDASLQPVFQGNQGFFELVKALSQSYSQSLPEEACRQQMPQGYVGAIAK